MSAKRAGKVSEDRATKQRAQISNTAERMTQIGRKAKIPTIVNGDKKPAKHVASRPIVEKVDASTQPSLKFELLKHQTRSKKTTLPSSKRWKSTEAADLQKQTIHNVPRKAKVQKERFIVVSISPIDSRCIITLYSGIVDPSHSLISPA